MECSVGITQVDDRGMHARLPAAAYAHLGEQHHGRDSRTRALRSVNGQIGYAARIRAKNLRVFVGFRRELPSERHGHDPECDEYGGEEDVRTAEPLVRPNRRRGGTHDLCPKVEHLDATAVPEVDAKTRRCIVPHYYAVAFTDTLMAMDNDLGFHVQSGDRHSSFYFRIPDAWAAGSDAELQQKIFGVAQQMYVDLNAGFRAAEPSDLSYMLVKATHARRRALDGEPHARRDVAGLLARRHHQSRRG